MFSLFFMLSKEDERHRLGEAGHGQN